jgi:hypothetical protein
MAPLVFLEERIRKLVSGLPEYPKNLSWQATQRSLDGRHASLRKKGLTCGLWSISTIPPPSFLPLPEKDMRHFQV